MIDQRLQARIAALEAELQSLKQAVAGSARAADESDGEGPPKSDRRGMVKLLAAGAVGAVTGAAILNAQPAAAADGGAVLQGNVNNATAATTLNSSAASALVVNGAGGFGIEADGNFGNAWFPGSAGSPAGVGGNMGVLWVDGEGNWWGATADSTTDGLWRKLAGPGTAGQLHILPAPVRVYDSRPGQAPLGGVKSPTVGNEAREIDTTGAATGVASGVPIDANAVLITLTIAGPSTPGFATAWPSGAFPGTSNINFSADQNIATTTVVGCGPSATIQVLSNTVTDFLIDVVGYYQ